MQRRTFIKQSALMLTLACTPVTFAASLETDEDKHPSGKNYDAHIKDRLIKKRVFDQRYEADIQLKTSKFETLDQTINRLKRIQRLVGYGNFCLLNFDDALNIAKAYTRVGRFSKEELAFMEQIFYTDGKTYGFMGDKPIQTITGRIEKKKVKKIPYTGNYLFLGKPMERYFQIKKEIGKDVILTSGVRSVVKQFLLFLNKAKSAGGNLSMASRSLAPPGYSFHGVGDFDVGKKGYGIHNFTERFTRTKVYRQLSDLGYVKFRYERDNDLGVRFEPWHIEV